MTFLKKISKYFTLFGLIIFFLFARSIIYASSYSWSFNQEADYTFDIEKITILDQQAQLFSGNDWYDNDWKYRKPITVDNSANTSDFYNVQVEINLTNSNFDFNLAKDDGADIIFTNSDGITQLKYWQETYDKNLQTATIHVRVPELSGGANHTIYIYYGNLEAVASTSWDNTFLESSTDPNSSYIDTSSTHDAFPGATLLNNGDILIAYRSATSHLSNDGVIKLLKSTDDGVSWTTSTIYNDVAVDDRTSLGLTKLTNGNLILPFYKYNNSTSVRTAFVLISTDNGDTWSMPYSVIEPFSLPRITPYGQIIEKSNGDLQMPVYAQNSGQKWRAALMKSSDGGESWSLQSTIAYNSGINFTETDVLKIDDNNYIAISRNDLSDPDTIYQINSTDAGDTWGTPTLLFEGVSPSLTRLSSGNIQLCLGDRSVSHGVRCHLSTDNGQTWGDGIMVYEGDYFDPPDIGYPSTVQLADDSLITFSYEKITGNNTDLVKSVYNESFLKNYNYYNFFEGLESGNLANWNLYSGNSVSAQTTIKHSGNYAFELNDTDSVNTTSGLLAFPDARNTGIVSWWIYSDNISSGNNFGLADGTTSPSDIRFQLSIRPTTGKLQYYNGTSYQDLASPVTITSDTWYKITMKFNSALNTTEVFVNGVSKGTIGRWNTGIEIRYLFFATGSTGGIGDKYYIDDIFFQPYIPETISSSFGDQDLIYASDNPIIKPISSKSLSFVNLTSFEETSNKNGGEIKYQLSNDGGLSWFWLNTNWNTASENINFANTAEEINSNIDTFPVGDGSLLFKAFLNSDGTNLVKLTSVNVVYEGIPSPTPTVLPTYNITTNSQNNTDNQVSCNDISPSSSPFLWGATALGPNSIKLQFGAAGDPVTRYSLIFGNQEGKYQWGSENIGDSQTREYLVKSLAPNTQYYFKIRAENGCKASEWSQEITTRTWSSIASNKLQLFNSSFDINENSSDKKISDSCLLYTIKPGDSLWTIAENYYQNGLKYSEIIKDNKSKYPSLETSNLLEIGWDLQVNCFNSHLNQNSNIQQNNKNQEQYHLKVKVINDQSQLVKGATVTLHSKVQQAITNHNGIAEFKNVEPGNHRLIIAYDNYEGEQSVFLDGDKNEIAFTVAVKEKPLTLSKLAILIIFFLVIIITALIIKIITLKKFLISKK